MRKIGQKKWLVLSALLFVTGIGLIAYPFISHAINSRQQAKVVDSYVENTTQDTQSVSDTLLAEAIAHNETLAKNGIHWLLTEEEQEAYEQYLRLDDTDVMAYIEIPKIDCMLPIYHGTSESVLARGVGHLEGSSLPVGGAGTHCVLSGHCGLPSARLFTDLDQLEEGDTFTIRVLEETLTYTVDQICVVVPTDFSQLQIEEGKDYCTLVTCTPYGINTHRLLVRGSREKKIDDQK